MIKTSGRLVSLSKYVLASLYILYNASLLSCVIIHTNERHDKSVCNQHERVRREMSRRMALVSSFYVNFSSRYSRLKILNFYKRHVYTCRRTAEARSTHCSRLAPRTSHLGRRVRLKGATSNIIGHRDPDKRFLHSSISPHREIVATCGKLRWKGGNVRHLIAKQSFLCCRLILRCKNPPDPLSRLKDKSIIKATHFVFFLANRKKRILIAEDRPNVVSVVIGGCSI